VVRVPRSTLTQWLRERDDHTLVELLRIRPDLATPPPADTAVLAARAGARASVARAAEGLDTVALAVLDALVVSDADRDAVPLTDVYVLLGTSPRIRPALDELRRLALAWGDDDAISLVPAAREVCGQFPAGLGRRSALLNEEEVPALLAAISDEERRLLNTLAHGQPIGRTRDAATTVSLEDAETPVQRLLARGLLIRRDAETVELPRQVGIALRGDTPLGTVAWDEPDPHGTVHRLSTVDATAAGEVLELVRRMEGLLLLWSEEPPPVLKSGGLGVRDLRRLARELDADDRQAGLLAELALGAGLVADTATSNPEWVPTTQADAFLGGGPANRWATLAAGWLDLPRLPGLSGLRDNKDRLLAPLSEDLRRPSAPAERRRVLAALAELPPGTGVAPDDLAAVLAWRAPRRGGRLRDELVRWTLTEATALGLVALGAVSSPGRALLLDEGPVVAAKRMLEAMPAPVDHVLVQADHTVVAPGPLELDLAERINETADVESAGSATVYRVTEASVRRALDAGRTATELHELFAIRSRTPVPQSLTYLIDDVARKHGRLRGGMAGSFLRCDDPALLAEIIATPVAGVCELRKIAPTVLVSPLPLVEVVDELRKAGYSPVAEGPDGQILDLRQPGRRVPAPSRTRRPVAPRQASDDQLAELVRTLRAGDRAAGGRLGRTVTAPGGLGAADTAATVALLREAIELNSQVWIWFVDSHGTASQRIVDPFRVGGGLLEGRDVTHGTVRQYPLHRITSAALVDNRADSD
jgi:hypothetical protein